MTKLKSYSDDLRGRISTFCGRFDLPRRASPGVRAHFTPGPSKKLVCAPSTDCSAQTDLSGAPFSWPALGNAPWHDRTALDHPKRILHFSPGARLGLLQLVHDLAHGCALIQCFALAQAHRHAPVRFAVLRLFALGHTLLRGSSPSVIWFIPPSSPHFTPLPAHWTWSFADLPSALEDDAPGGESI